MPSRVLAVLALLLIFSFSFRVNAEVVKIAIYSSNEFHASMKKWQSTADYLSVKLPQHIFQILPYTSLLDVKTDLEKNKLDFLLTAKRDLPQFVAEFALSPVLNTKLSKQDDTWTLAQNQQLSYQLTHSISDALLKLPTDHQAIKHAEISGWKLSADTKVVISTGQKLKQLYSTSIELLATLSKQYWSLFLAVLMSGFLIWTYRKWDIYHREQQVKKHREQSNDPSLSDTVF